MRINIIFFGSTSDSVLVVDKLSTYHFSHIAPRLLAVVTQPPRPVGRKHLMTPTAVEVWAKAHNIPALSFPHRPDHPHLFADEQAVIDSLQPIKADVFISASFGQRIPMQAIHDARFGGINIHPSLLPRWRGADPVPWAIMAGDAQTGVSIITLSEHFDEGAIIAQKKIPITEHDFADPLRTQLFKLGAELFVHVLPEYLKKEKEKEKVQSYYTRRVKMELHPFFYARRLTRQDGFEPWKTIQKAFADPKEAKRIDRKFRALHPWPGLWTEVPVRAPAGEASQHGNVSEEKKRLKIISLHRRMSDNDAMTLALNTVQLEGKIPVAFSQFRETYLDSLITE